MTRSPTGMLALMAATAAPASSREAPGKFDRMMPEAGEINQPLFNRDARVASSDDRCRAAAWRRPFGVYEIGRKQRHPLLVYPARSSAVRKSRFPRRPAPHSAAAIRRRPGGHRGAAALCTGAAALCMHAPSAPPGATNSATTESDETVRPPDLRVPIKASLAMTSAWCPSGERAMRNRRPLATETA